MFLVCGEALYDVFLESGDDLAAFSMNARAGGSPFNVAIGLARLGQSSSLLTGMSHDELGNRLTAMLERESVNTDYLVRTGRRTTVVMVSVNELGQPDYSFYGVGSADCGVKRKHLPEIGDEITGIHFGSYSLVVNPVAKAFASLLPQVKDRFISLDPNIRPTIEPDMELWRKRMWQYAAYADSVKISAEDIEALYPAKSHDQLADEFIASGVKLVTITDGSNSVRCWTKSGLTAERQPIIDRVVDTVGAGDTFQAAMLAKLITWGDPKKRISELTPKDLDELLEFSVKAASITCSRRGANLPRLEELQN